MKLLLAEDERRMAQALGELLRQEGYEVDVFYDGASALDALLSNIYDGAVLDVMMPERSGYSVTSEARRHGVRTPILLLTARAGTEDKVTGLDSGADDYLTKPFQVQELLARLRALLRRGTGYADTSLTYGDISLEPGSAMLTCIKTGQMVRVSDKELRLLEHLIRNSGHIVTREQLALKIWGYDSDAEYNNVEVYLSFTRKKLLFVGSQTEIKAVRGLGYELRCEHVS